MNRDNIQKMIHDNNLTTESNWIGGVMVRRFEELLKLDEQLKGDNITEQNLQKLRQENAALEQNILEVNSKIEQAVNDASKTSMQDQAQLDDLKNKGSELDEKIKSLEVEGDGILLEIKRLADKQTEMERLEGNKKELQAEYDKQKAELVSLGEDYKAKVELRERLTEFVDKIETIEKRMSSIMDEIWQGVKNDAFDRSMKDARIK